MVTFKKRFVTDIDINFWTIFILKWLFENSLIHESSFKVFRHANSKTRLINTNKLSFGIENKNSFSS